MTILYQTGFESGLSGLTLSGTTAPIQSDEQAYSGTYSAKSRLSAVVGGVAEDYRSELTGFTLSSTGTKYFAHNTDYKFGAAIYIPSDYHTTPDSQGDIVWQMHNDPYGTSVWTNPSWALVIANNSWRVNRKTGTAADTTLIPVVKGAWTRLVIEFKLVDGSGGYFRLYINDELVFDYTGDTALQIYAGGNGYRPYIKLGLYCWVRKDPGNSAYPGTSTAAIVVYYDQIKIGDAAATYADVDPASGSAGTAGPSITSINTTDTIVASTAVNTAVTVGLAGVISGTVSDGTDSETVQAVGYPSGTSVAFTTGALTNIGTPANVSFDYAEPDYYSIAATTWDDNFSTNPTRTAHTTDYGPYTDGLTLTNTAGASNGSRTAEVVLTGVQIGDVIDVEFAYIPGTGNKVLCECRKPSAEQCQVMGTVGSLALGTTTLATGTPTFTDVASTIWPAIRHVRMSFVCAVAGDINAGIGTYSNVTGDTITVLGGRAWKNRTLSTRSRSVTIPALIPTANSAPTITTVGAITSGSSVAVTGNGLKAVIAAKISDGVTDSVIDDWVPNADGTAATFTAPFGMAASGNSLVVTWAPYAIFDNVPTAWADNSGGALGNVANTTDYWISTDAADLISGGVAWHRTTIDGAYARTGDTVTTEFYYVAGTSPNAYLSVRNSVVGDSFAYQGSIGSLQLNTGSFGAAHAITESVINGVRKSAVTFSTGIDGQLTVGLGPYSENDGATITPLAIRQYTNRNTGTASFGVTVTGSETKKFVWSIAAGNAIYRYNATTNSLTPFTGDMAVTITDGDWFAVGDDVNELAYAPSVAFVSGEAEMVESDLSFGSINALLTGAQGYNFWMTNGSDCRADNAIELSAE